MLFGYLKFDFNYMLVGVDENGNVFEKQTPVKYHNHEPVFTQDGWHLKEEQYTEYGYPGSFFTSAPLDAAAFANDPVFVAGPIPE